MRVSLGLVISVAVLMSLAAGVVFAGHSWGGYHWARSTSIPLTLSLGDNVSGKWDARLAEANMDWNASAQLDNSVDPGRTNPRKCNPPDGLVEICNAKYGFNGWLGISGIWVYSGGHIAKGYVKLNDSYFNTSTYDTPAWRQLVMCQEIGHQFGLGHQDENFGNDNLGTCMDYTSSPAGNGHPNQHDYDQLVAIYAHSDNYDSWADPPADGDSGGGKGKKGKSNKGDPPGQGVSDWGKCISKDGKGRCDLFELDLGEGNKLFTHVTWAETGNPDKGKS